MLITWLTPNNIVLDYVMWHDKTIEIKIINIDSGIVSTQFLNLIILTVSE